MEELWQERLMAPAAAPVPSPIARPSRQRLPAWDRRTWLVAIPLALIVIYAFLPALDNGFSPLDDNQSVLDNPYVRGLGAAQVKWAWSATLLGVYQPLAWLLFEIQYVFCQLDPRGYHLTSLLLHVANAVVLYVLTLALLVRCQTDSWLTDRWTLSLSAGLATALFAVHPLRVEAVAWVSAQMYLPCALCSMLSVLAYLCAFWTDSSPRWGWLAGSFLLFVAALLFHPVPVNLPAVLLILDVYPLRRFPDETGRWFGATGRRALLEKVPFVMTSLFFMGLAVAVRVQSPFLTEHYDASVGIAQACYGTWFYIQKTVLPLDLTPLYKLPRELNWLALPVQFEHPGHGGDLHRLVSAAPRWPGLLVAWLSYLLILAPNSGLIRNNRQEIAADRYSYMAMLGLVPVAAVCFCRLWPMSSRWRRSTAIGIIAIGLGALVVLTAMTRIQCRTWLNSETVWAHAFAHWKEFKDLPLYNLGVLLQNKGNYQAAAAHYAEALRLNPANYQAQNNLGNVLYIQGKHEAAVAHYTEALRLNLGYADAHNNLGVALKAMGRYQEAEAQYVEAVRLDPSDVKAQINLGVVLSREGKYEEAEAHYAEAIRLGPSFAGAYNASAMVKAACPEAKFRDGKKAVQFATRACELTKWKDPSILDTLAAAQAEAGDFDTAVSSQKKAVELLTDERQKDGYRSRLVLYQAKKPYRQVSPQNSPTEPRP